MNTHERYQDATNQYGKLQIDTEQAMSKTAGISISMHCWQGDDVMGFDRKGPLTGGIQATGNYPYRARNKEEVFSDIDKTLSYIPGKHFKINLHASYAIFHKNEWVDRDQIKPEHFKEWADFAKKRGLGLDFNPTLFSHPLSTDATLSSEKEEVRKFWVRHCIASIRISEYLASETGQPCLMNIWIPDGMKEIPADRRGPRERLKKSLDEILSVPYDKSKVYISLESKVFGIGMESYTVGSHEFYMNYASKNNLLCLLDTGHFHPTENVADKLSAMLLFNNMIALHVSRPVRWDSDHVPLFNDSLRDIAGEIVKNGPEHFFIGMDYFDASINRIAAWVIGMRSMEKALLWANLVQNEYLKKLQDERDFTRILAYKEAIKELPFGAVWDEYCERNHVLTEEQWFDDCKEYETDILSKRALTA